MNKAKLIHLLDVVLPYVVLATLLLIFHFCINTYFGDDLAFSEKLNDVSLFPWLAERYQTWSSRTINEFFLVTVTRVPILWKFLDTGITVLGAWAIFRLVGNKDSRIIRWIICALLLCLPAYLYCSCGYMATTIGYFWIGYIGLVAFIPVRKIFDKEIIKWWEYIFYFLALVFACTHEQMCAIYIVAFGVLFTYRTIKDKKPNWYMLTSLVIIIGFMLYILLCPGNQIRTAEEVERWYPTFNELSIFEKFEKGYSATVFEYMFKPNLLYWLLAAILPLGVFLSSKKIYARIVSFIPITISIVFSILLAIHDNYQINSMFYFKPFATNYFEMFNIPWWLVDIISLHVAVAIGISIYSMLEDKKVALGTIGILLLGAMTRMMMSLSPTIYASASRPYFFMYLALIITITILFKSIKLDKARFIYQYYVFFFAILGWINIMMYLYA